MFSAVSYSSRNKYLSTNDKIYSIVVQETQAKLALTEVAENIFQYNLNLEPNNQEEEFRASIQDRSTSTKDKVVPFWNSSWSKHKPKKDCFLGFIFPEPSLMQSWKKLQSFTIIQNLFPELCNWCSLATKKSLEQLYKKEKVYKKQHNF